jgi:hypothetical protein
MEKGVYGEGAQVALQQTTRINAALGKRKKDD